MSQNSAFPRTMAIDLFCTNSPRLGGSGTGTVLSDPSGAGGSGGGTIADAPPHGPTVKARAVAQRKLSRLMDTPHSELPHLATRLGQTRAAYVLSRDRATWISRAARFDDIAHALEHDKFVRIPQIWRAARRLEDIRQSFK